MCLTALEYPGIQFLLPYLEGPEVPPLVFVAVLCGPWPVSASLSVYCPPLSRKHRKLTGAMSAIVDPLSLVDGTIAIVKGAEPHHVIINPFAFET